MTAAALLFFLLFVHFISANATSKVVQVNIDYSQVLAQVDSRFLSVALDSHIVAERWKNFDFKASRVINMAKALSPAYLRLGGTAADLLYFKEVDIFGIPKKDFTKSNISSASCYCTENQRTGSKICEDLQGRLYKNRTAFPMTGQDWIDINNFVKKVGWSFLFDVNVLVRNKRKQWR